MVGNTYAYYPSKCKIIFLSVELESWGEDSFSSQFSQKLIDLSAYAGQTICIAFRLTNDHDDGWYIDKVEVSKDLSIPEHVQGKLKIYPNPTSRFLNIDVTSLVLDSDLEISILDVLGQTQIQQKLKAGNKQAVINVQDLAAGTYIVHIKAVSWEANYKVLIE